MAARVHRRSSTWSTSRSCWGTRPACNWHRVLHRPRLPAPVPSASLLHSDRSRVPGNIRPGRAPASHPAAACGLSTRRPALCAGEPSAIEPGRHRQLWRPHARCGTCRVRELAALTREPAREFEGLPVLPPEPHARVQPAYEAEPARAVVPLCAQVDALQQSSSAAGVGDTGCRRDFWAPRAALLGALVAGSPPGRERPERQTWRPPREGREGFSPSVSPAPAPPRISPAWPSAKAGCERFSKSLTLAAGVDSGHHQTPDSVLASRDGRRARRGNDHRSHLGGHERRCRCDCRRDEHRRGRRNRHSLDRPCRRDSASPARGLRARGVRLPRYLADARSLEGCASCNRRSQ